MRMFISGPVPREEDNNCVKSVRIRSYSGPNAGKCEPELLRIRPLLTQWICLRATSKIEVSLMILPERKWKLYMETDGLLGTYNILILPLKSIKLCTPMEHLITSQRWFWRCLHHSFVSKFLKEMQLKYGLCLYQVLVF